MFEPYEKSNLIFIDTEFSDLDPYTGEILSIGIVKLSGEELYLELEFSGTAHKWVTKHILPTLTSIKFSREDAVDQVKEFLGSTQPYAVGFVDNYDVIYLTKLFGAGKLPFKWQTIDFASILFAVGISPEKSPSGKNGPKAFYRKLGIDMTKYRKHHALDDARMLRDVWLKVTSEPS